MHPTRIPRLSRPLESRPNSGPLRRLLIVASGIGAAFSFFGLIWTYVSPAFFSIGSFDHSKVFGLPHEPIFASLAAMCFILKIATGITMPEPPNLKLPWLGRNMSVPQIPFVLAIILSVVCYLGPIWTMDYHASITMAPNNQVPIPTGLQFGCAASRCGFTILGIGFLTDAVYGVWWNWQRGIVL